jgi:HTH-type transcriptional regulator / antitoxin HipB
MSSFTVPSCQTPSDATASMSALGSFIKSTRKENSLTQAEIFSLVGWGNRFIGDVERGKKTVRADMLFALLNWLGYEVVIRKRTKK